MNLTQNKVALLMYAVLFMCSCVIALLVGDTFLSQVTSNVLMDLCIMVFAEDLRRWISVDLMDIDFEPLTME